MREGRQSSDQTGNVAFQRPVLRLGVPTHFRPTNENVSACGVEHPQFAAYDGRYVDCILCRRTKVWKKYMGQDRKNNP